MKPVDRYIHEVMHQAFAAKTDKERLEADLRAHFAEAEERGEPLRETLDGLGTPGEVAAALSAERPIEYASFFQRFAAFLGDCGALVLLAWLPMAGAVLILARFEHVDAPPIVWLASLAALGLSALGVFALYFPLLEARFGRTLGKQLMKIRVVRETGAPISIGQGFVRRLSMYFEFLVIDALFVPFTQKKQRALDIVARTIVAREPGEESGVGSYLLCLLMAGLGAAGLAALLALCAA